MITLFHDYTSPASAVAVARAHRLLDEGIDLEVVGFEAIGVDMLLPVTLDVLAELDTVRQAAQAEGVTLRRPRILPPTGPAHVVERALHDDAARRWRGHCYAMFWTQGRNIAERDVLIDVALAADLDTDTVRALLDEPGRLAAVRRATTERRRDGVGGVPTILAQRTLVPGLLGDDDLWALAAL